MTLSICQVSGETQTQLSSFFWGGDAYRVVFILIGAHFFPRQTLDIHCCGKLTGAMLCCCGAYGPYSTEAAEEEMNISGRRFCKFGFQLRSKCSVVKF